MARDEPAPAFSDDRARGDPGARALAAGVRRAIPSNRVSGNRGRDRARAAAVLRHAPLRRRQALLRHLSRPGARLLRRPRAQHRPRPRRPQRHRARQPAPQPLVRLVRRRRQPVGAEHPPDPGRQGARGHGRARARARWQPTRTLAAAYARVFGSAAGRRRSPSWRWSTSPRRWRPSRRPSSRAAPRSTTSATRWSAATGRPWPAIPSRRSAACSIFVGKGQCSVCHFGPNFTNGEFDDVGVPYFAEPGRVDQGRHGGIAAAAGEPLQPARRLQRRPRAGRPRRRPGMSSRSTATGASSACRRCATSALTAPYMHNGSLPTLEAVVRHYSEVDVERLHGDDGARLVRPLRLSAARDRRPRQLPRDALRARLRRGSCGA